MALKMEGETGVIAPGYLADIICVKGRVEENIASLGDPANITTVMIGGVEKDLSPPPKRKPIPGWRLASMGSRLSREVAFGPEQEAEPLIVEELH
jgi:hypothetical protein